jgi:hypothetical protein
MDKDKFIKIMKEYGDAYVTYVSPNSKKEKFNVGTIDIDSNLYIRSKAMSITPDPKKVIIFCWDTDSYRQIDPSTVVRVEPLSAELERSRSRNGRRYNERDSVRI